MIKAFIKHLLFLFILLLSGYGHLSAHSYEVSIKYATLNESGYGSFGNLNDRFFINTSSSSGTEKNYTIKVTGIEIEEEEEDEWISFKKHVESSNFFTTLFYTYLSENFSQSIKNCLSFFKQFPNLSSTEPLYLVLRVFRL